jgi:regulator of protease activity HflC (stomatin/prohibitin superfamily)
MAKASAGSSGKRRRGIGYWLRDKAPFFVVAILILIIVALFFFSRIFIVVHSGEAGVLYRTLTTGTETNYIFPEKLHIIYPWNTMHIYNVRVQTRYHELTVLTNKGLPITLKLAIRFKPEYDMVGLLHKHVGPDYVEKIIIPQIESVLRKNIGQLNPEDVYTNKEGVLNRILRIAIDEASRKYVNVDDIIIREVKLPDMVRTAIEEKLVEEQILQKYEFKLQVAGEEAKRKKIEAGGIRDYQQTINETLTASLIKWQAVNATERLIESQNAKVVIIGAGEQGLPVILGNQWNSEKPAKDEVETTPNKDGEPSPEGQPTDAPPQQPAPAAEGAVPAQPPAPPAPAPAR